jgi:hypothetical protein
MLSECRTITILHVTSLWEVVQIDQQHRVSEPAYGFRSQPLVTASLFFNSADYLLIQPNLMYCLTGHVLYCTGFFPSRACGV